MRTVTVMLLSLTLFTVPAIAQTTRPAEEMAKENAALKKRIDKLEAYVAELEAKVRSSPRGEIVPRFKPAPYGYALPAPPLKIPTPAPMPKPPETKPVPPGHMPVVPPPPRYVPDNWQKREFNGQEFYLIPLR